MSANIKALVLFETLARCESESHALHSLAFLVSGTAELVFKISNVLNYLLLQGNPLLNPTLHCCYIILDKLLVEYSLQPEKGIAFHTFHDGHEGKTGIAAQQANNDRMASRTEFVSNSASSSISALKVASTSSIWHRWTAYYHTTPQRATARILSATKIQNRDSTASPRRQARRALI